jgi:uncharacterized protein (DUF2235 family)
MDQANVEREKPAGLRNLVLCFDGTNNEFGPENTHVVRLIQVLDRDPARQRLYYDPGVGTLPRPGKAKVSAWRSKLSGLAFGAGLRANVEEAYEYLMDNWEPGDRVFIFGFSRGAYTARALAGLLHLLGLLPRGNRNLVPYVMDLFRAIRKDRSPGKSRYWQLCDEFRWTFARPAFEGDDQRHFRVHFAGVWDTVSSVGWVWNPTSYQFTHRNPSVGRVRHALAVDERRWFFRQNQMEPAFEGQDVEEMWFSGVHSDVGGGYPEADGGLWRPTFDWMLGAAEDAGLVVDAARLHEVLNRTPPPAKPWKEPQHESLGLSWWLGEFVPKWRWSPKTRQHAWRIGAGKHRFIRKGSRVHWSVLLRIREMPYSPPNLTPEFLRKVRDLTDVPPWLETDSEFD